MKLMRLSACFSNTTYHGSEWPPSPMRIYQAIIAGAASQNIEDSQISKSMMSVLEWFESLPNPTIITRSGNGSSLANKVMYVPNNDDDLSMKALASGADQQTILEARRERYAKKVLKKRFVNDPIHYYWVVDSDENAGKLISLSEHVGCIGRGIDSAWIDGAMESEIPDLTDYSVWRPSSAPTQSSLILFSPIPGSLKSIIGREYARRNRIKDKKYVDPPIAFDRATYDSQPQKTERLYRLFDLRQPNGRDFLSWRPENLIVVSAMVRHQLANRHKGRELFGFVTGHAENNDLRLSWIPLPSIGHGHADGFVRRLMILGSPGVDNKLINSAIHGLNFSELKKYDSEEEIGIMHISEKIDGAVEPYFRKSDTWHTITPLLLPGYITRGHDQKGKLVPQKIEKLVQKALQSSGLPEAKEIIIQKAPFLKNGVKAGDFQTPKHLSRYPQYHLKITFPFTIEGPVVAGVGRHYGLGLFAASRTTG